VRVTRASVKKVPAPRNPKRASKTKDVDVSLEAHTSMISPNDVSDFLFDLLLLRSFVF
jgi:hypothetical protein